MTRATAYEHIVINEADIPLIEGTTTKVIELVLDMLAYGWSLEELQFQHPHLTLGQIHSALTYYRDHKEELDDDIERRLERVNKIRREVGPLTLSNASRGRCPGGRSERGRLRRRVPGRTRSSFRTRRREYSRLLILPKTCSLFAVVDKSD